MPKENHGPYISKEAWEWMEKDIGWRWKRLSPNQINQLTKQNLTPEKQYQRQWQWIWENDFFVDFDKSLSWPLRSEFKNSPWFKTINLSRDEIEFKAENGINRKKVEKNEGEIINFFHYMLLNCWVMPQLEAIGKKLDPGNSKRGALIFELKDWDIDKPLERNIPARIPSIEITAKKWVKFLIGVNSQIGKCNVQCQEEPEEEEEEEEEDLCPEGGEHEWEYNPALQEKVCLKCGEERNYDPMQYVQQSKYTVGGTKAGELSTIERLTELAGWKPENEHEKKDLMREVIETLYRNRTPPNTMNFVIENTLNDLANILGRVGRKRGARLKLVWSIVLAKNIKDKWSNVNTDNVLKYLLKPDYLFWENPSGPNLEMFERIQAIQEENPKWLMQVEILINGSSTSPKTDVSAIEYENWVNEGILAQYEELEIILQDKGVFLNQSNEEKAALIYIIMNKINGDSKYSKIEISRLFNVPIHRIKPNQYLTKLKQKDKYRIKLIYPF